jgi:hypothetical protein
MHCALLRDLRHGFEALERLKRYARFKGWLVATAFGFGVHFSSQVLLFPSTRHLFS